jgi:hypothetical protein
MKLEQHCNGTWRVVSDDGRVLASGLSHADAWRYVDRHDSAAIAI